MIEWLKSLFGSPKGSLRGVPGALTARTADGQVIYNMLTPHMQQFMRRCINAIKRDGIAAKGTGQFSVLIGERKAELQLDQYFQPIDDPTIVERVVAAAKSVDAAR
jgi:hypothetical protein